jgi:hypothetical protein
MAFSDFDQVLVGIAVMVPRRAGHVSIFRSSVAGFYSLLKCFFFSFADVDRRDRFTILFRRLLLDPEVEKIPHRTSEILFAAKASVLWSAPRMDEQELNLLKLTAALWHSLDIAPQAVRCNVL